MSEPRIHQSHPEINKRLKRAGGHLKTIIAMIEQGRSCVDIAQQLHAVEKAICNAKKALIRDHIDHCLEQTVGPMARDARAPIDEFKEISRYLWGSRDASVRLGLARFHPARSHSRARLFPWP